MSSHVQPGQRPEEYKIIRKNTIFRDYRARREGK